MSQYRFQLHIFSNFLAPALKRSFSNDRCRHFALGVWTATSNTRFFRTFSSPSNHGYCMSLWRSVLEQSIQDRSGVRFSTQPIFPPLMLNQWRTDVHVITCQRRPVDSRVPCCNMTHLPCETTTFQNLAVNFNQFQFSKPHFNFQQLQHIVNNPKCCTRTHARILQF